MEWSRGTKVKVKDLELDERYVSHHNRDTRRAVQENVNFAGKVVTVSDRSDASDIFLIKEDGGRVVFNTGMIEPLDENEAIVNG